MTFRASRVIVSISRKHATHRTKRGSLARERDAAAVKARNSESRNGRTKEKGYGSVRASDTKKKRRERRDTEETNFLTPREKIS